jgi:hypothetical protein
VPVDRTDDSYFARLRELHVHPRTELYAGLVHLPDRPGGVQLRIAAAERALNREFGIATECGFGRRDPHTVPALLQLHAGLATPLVAPVPV